MLIEFFIGCLNNKMTKFYGKKRFPFPTEEAKRDDPSRVQSKRSS